MPKPKQNHSPAFTIVELLIVIVIIAVLATISIVAYNGLQNRARASEASAALTQAAKKIKVWQVENADTTPPDLATVGITNSGNVSFQYKPGTQGSYCITATSGTVSYKVTDTSQPTQGGCSGHGQGGSAAVTNLALNPSLESNNATWQGWAGSGGAASFARPTTGGRTGAAFHRLIWTTAGNGGGVAFNTPAVAGKTYTTSAWVRTSKNATIACFWQNGGASQISFNLTANTWTRVSCTGTVPSGQTNIQLNAYNFNAAAGDWVDGDDGMVTEGSTLYNYADGNSQDWDWNGTPNNSTSSGPML